MMNMYEHSCAVTNSIEQVTDGKKYYCGLLNRDGSSKASCMQPTE